MKVTVVSMHDLPKTSQAWRYVTPKLTASRAVAIHLLNWHDAWPDQTHVTFHNAPKLGQLIDASATEKGTNVRNDAGILPQLQGSLVLESRGRIRCKILGEALFRIRDHGSDFPDAYLLTV
jgi:hypothetical protein